MQKVLKLGLLGCGRREPEKWKYLGQPGKCKIKKSSGGPDEMYR